MSVVQVPAHSPQLPRSTFTSFVYAFREPRPEPLLLLFLLVFSLRSTASVVEVFRGLAFGRIYPESS